MDEVRTVLSKAEAQLTALGTIYDADLELQRLSPTLRGKLNAFLEGQRSALDLLAAKLVVVAGGTAEGNIYYPLAPDPTEFEAYITKHTPGVLANRPDIAEVIARHQPGHVPGLAQLRTLLIDEKQRRLVPETIPVPVDPDAAAATESVPAAPLPPMPPAAIPAGLSGAVYIDGVAHDPVTLRRLVPLAEAPRDKIYTAWKFAFESGEVSALPVLQAIQSAVAAAIEEISATAGLNGI